MSTIESLELEIKSNSESAVSGVEALTRSLEKLRDVTKGGAGLSSVAKNLGAIKDAANGVTTNTVNNMTGLSKAVETLSKNKLSSSTGKAIAEISKSTDKASKSFYSFTDVYHGMKSFVGGIVKAGKSIMSVVDKSMDYTENQNLFNVAMGEYASEAMEYAEKVSGSLGIDTSEWIRAQGVFMTLATGFGVAGDRANTMSKNLTQLGYDLASFYNMDTETAMLKLKSGLAGELEPLRDIGYDLSQAKLEATALELGITKSVSAMTQAEKAQLRYYAIMTQVTSAQGDMARTLDDPANQMRVFKAQVSMAAREIGNVFIPALNAILPVATAVAKVIGNLASIISGFRGSEGEGVSDASDKLAENTSIVTENLEEAQEEAKKLKSYMLGFDELNVINPNTDSAQEGSSGWVDFELPDYSEKFLNDEVQSRVNQIVDGMKEWLGITEEINSWSDLISTNFGNILVSVGLIAGVIASWQIASGVATIMKDIERFKNTVKLFGTLMKGVGIAVVVAMAAAGAKWLIENTDSTMTKIGAILSAASLGLGAILAFTGINVPLGIALMAVGAVSMGAAIAMNTSALSDEVKGVIGVITAVVSAALLAVGAILAFTGVNIPLGLALMAGGAIALVTAVIPNWNTIVDALRGTVGEIVNVISSALIAIGALLLLSGVGIPLGLALLAAGAVGLVTMIAVNWNSIGSVLTTALSTIAAIVSGFMVVIGVLLLMSGAGIGLGLALIFGGLVGTVAAWKLDNNPITRFMKNMLNSIIMVVNEIIGLINDVVGAFSFGIIKIPMIPLMADGGFPETGQMFIAREAGAEMVGNIGRKTAVANNDQIVSGIAGGVAEANEEQNALLREQNTLLRALVEKDSGVYLDGRRLTDSVEKHQRERGRVLITGGVL